MTFSPTFGRTFSPTFQPSSQAAAGGGWWDLNGTITSCFAAYQAIGVASYAASKINLVNPGTYDLMDGQGNVTNATNPTWDSAGWTFNGTTALVYNDALAPEFQGTDTSLTTIVRCQFDTLAAYSVVFGVGNSSVTQPTYTPLRLWNDASKMSSYKRSSSGQYILIQKSAVTQGTNYVFANLDTGTTMQMYRNGSTDGSASSCDVATLALDRFTIGGFRYSSTPNGGNGIRGVINCIAFYKPAITEAQLQAISALMAAL